MPTKTSNLHIVCMLCCHSVYGLAPIYRSMIVSPYQSDRSVCSACTVFLTQVLDWRSLAPIFEMPSLSSRDTARFLVQSLNLSLSEILSVTCSTRTVLSPHIPISAFFHVLGIVPVSVYSA